MEHTAHDIRVARQIGTCSDAVEVAPNMRWLMTSGMPGLGADGRLPVDIESQSEIAWGNIVSVLRKADMTVHDVVKVTEYLVRPEDISACAKVKELFLGDVRPASTLLIVGQLARPEFLVAVEVVAAKEAAAKEVTAKR
jgi:enamine deaminase RidA (YjgF/YER057c/UK114 family)